MEERIEKLEVKIGKLEKKLAKYESLVSDEFKSIVEDVEKLRKYNREHYGWNYCCGDEDNYRRTLLDLKQANATLAKYKAKEAERNEEKIQVIWDFLEAWKNKAYDWYLENSKLYTKLRHNYDNEWEKVKEEYAYYSKMYNGEIVKKYYESSFERKYYNNINELTKEITSWNGSIDAEKLNKVLENEKLRKYKDLVNRVEKKVGKIVDASYLSIGAQNGEINGFVKGENGTCRVETISAGGYNIQCFHYRVLVK